MNSKKIVLGIAIVAFTVAAASTAYSLMEPPRKSRIAMETEQRQKASQLGQASVEAETTGTEPALEEPTSDSLIVDAEVSNSIENGTLVKTTTYTRKRPEPYFEGAPMLDPQTQQVLDNLDSIFEAKVEEQLYKSRLQAKKAKDEYDGQANTFDMGTVVPAGSVPKIIATTSTGQISSTVISQTSSAGQNTLDNRIQILAERKQKADADFALVTISSFLKKETSADVRLIYKSQQYAIEVGKSFGPFNVVSISQDSVLLKHRESGILRELTQQLVIPKSTLEADEA